MKKVVDNQPTTVTIKHMGQQQAQTQTKTSTETINFALMQSAVGKQFKAMSANRLYSTTVEGDKLWETYLSSFPPGSNPLYKTRTEHDCGCCRHFIKQVGGVVNIIDGKIVTLWDFEVDGPYQSVANAMAELVRSHVIKNVYLHSERLVGVANSRQLLEDKTVKSWNHYYVNLPDSAVVRKSDIGTKLGKSRTTHDVMLRALTEISIDAVATVLELIAQNSLYRGEEHKPAVQGFKLGKIKFEKLTSELERDLFVWENLSIHPTVAHIRNSVIGTLLVDLSEGKDLEDAVKSYEAKVAPTNYKRPTALVTKAMVAKAQETVNELGLATALERRYATLDDVKVNNLLFADRKVARAAVTDVFDEIAAGATVNVQKLGKVEEIPIVDFIDRVLPTAKSIEVLVENRHAGNLVSLIAPVDPTAKPLFKWDNGFSWSYTGDLADSIKERVKRAGGNVAGDFRASLAWFNHDDLDLHLEHPGGHIYFAQKVDYVSHGALDVDMNAGSGTSRTPVENIVFPDRGRMEPGEYRLSVHQFCKRETTDGGFDVEMEFDGVVHSFSYGKPVKQEERILVCKFDFTQKDGLVIRESLPSSQTSKKVWNLSTQAFHPVRAIMLSPNQWDGREIGNKHFFFMLDGCVNDGTARGFFNEFLRESLTPHRKVLEMVGAKMKTEASGEQLSGVGFSSTQRNHLVCKVTGAFTRTVKVLF